MILDPRGAYHLAKKSGNVSLKSNGKVIFRKFRSEIPPEMKYHLKKFPFQVPFRLTERDGTVDTYHYATVKTNRNFPTNGKHPRSYPSEKSQITKSRSNNSNLSSPSQKSQNVPADCNLARRSCRPHDGVTEDGSTSCSRFSGYSSPLCR